ncbi:MULTISPECIES: Ada metal-binding domain-containing protein [Flavobacteriaceae]|uniref:Ada metal-binding domain-containing protein n=1 Tax=Flavobacteriaceae TaxID=49546 RepID=UPI00234BEA27|nr:Ada metal-binding domain-containing protein [Muricauda sp. SP22]MDC6362911.1 Ada metal-binding domain-containing protein [Muricauda sp. SP22]
MLYHAHLEDFEVRIGIRQREITYAGHKKLKIYGTLKCTSGKRMKRENRVFFKTEKEALSLGYRPCGHCMRIAYKKWKDELVLQSKRP